MRFWDSSALVPLLVSEPQSVAAQSEYERDSDVVSWWASHVECVSALARLERDGSLSESGMTDAIGRLDALAAAWSEVQPMDRVRQVAVRLLRVHPLRAADALQVAAAIVASEGQPSTLPLVTFDDRLALAAEREGFPVVSPR
jgi:uncharacterized protein